MKTANDEIQKFIHQIKDRNTQIAVLVALQEQAVSKITQFAEETYEVNVNEFVVVQSQSEIGSNQSKFYIWDNIGEGG